MTIKNKSFYCKLAAVVLFAIGFLELVVGLIFEFDAIKNISLSYLFILFSFAFYYWSHHANN